MACRRPGEEPLSEPMMVIYLCIYASLGLAPMSWINSETPHQWTSRFWQHFFLCDNIQWEINHEKSQQFGHKMWYTVANSMMQIKRMHMSKFHFMKSYGQQTYFNQLQTLSLKSFDHFKYKHIYVTMSFTLCNNERPCNSLHEAQHLN